MKKRSKALRFTLLDDSSPKKIKGKVWAESGMVHLWLEGHGTVDDPNGPIAVLTCQDGKARFVVLGNVNSEFWSAIIDLDGALLANKDPNFADEEPDVTEGERVFLIRKKR